MALNLDERTLLQQYGAAKQTEIERLLQQYSTSLKDVREMYPQLTEAISQRRLMTSFPTEPVFFTPSEAAQMGLNLQEGWMLKMSPTEGNGGFTSSLITPQKWEISENDLYISPTGEKYSKADIEALLAPPSGLDTGITGIPTIENLNEEGQRLYEEYQQAGGALGVAGWIDLRERQQLETEEVFGAVFPEQDIQEVVTYMQENPEGFLADIRELGPTEDVVAMLKSLKFKDETTGEFRQFTDEEIQDFFGEAVPGFVPENWFKDNFIDPLYARAVSFRDNTLMVLTSIIPSVFASYTSPERQGERPTVKSMLAGIFPFGVVAETIAWNLGKKERTVEQEWRYHDIQRSAELWLNFYVDKQAKFAQEHPELRPNPEYLENPLTHPSLFLDPGYYAYSFSSSLAYTLSTMSTMIVVSAVGTPFLGIPAGMAVAGGPEASDMTQDLVRRGVPFEDAAKWGALYGLFAGGIETVSDLPFLGLVFKPFKAAAEPLLTGIRKAFSNWVLRKIAAGVAVTLTEGIEEGLTQIGQNAIIKYYDNTQSIWEGVGHSFIQATIGALPFGAIGGAASFETFEGALSPQSREQYNNLIADFQKAGLTVEQAQVQAANEVAKTEEGYNDLSKAIDVARQEYLETQGVTSVEELIPTPELADKILAEIKIAEGIKPTTITVVGTSEITLEQLSIEAKKLGWEVEPYTSSHIPRARYRFLAPDGGFHTFGNPQDGLNILQQLSWARLKWIEKVHLAQEAGFSRDIARKVADTDWGFLTDSQKDVLRKALTPEYYQPKPTAEVPSGGKQLWEMSDDELLQVIDLDAERRIIRFPKGGATSLRLQYPKDLKQGLDMFRQRAKEVNLKIPTDKVEVEITPETEGMTIEDVARKMKSGEALTLAEQQFYANNKKLVEAYLREQSAQPGMPEVKQPWQMTRSEYNKSVGEPNLEKIYYHATNEPSVTKFNTKEVWFDTAPRDYGDNIAQVSYNWKKPFITSLQEAEEMGLRISTEQVAKNKAIYQQLGGEVNPKTFDWLREQGYDVLIDDEGYAALYPDRVKILDWQQAESQFVNPNRIVKAQFHQALVERALKEGKPVPAEVLKDYPDLKPVTTEGARPYFTLKKAQELTRVVPKNLSDKQLQDAYVKARDYINYIDTNDIERLAKGGYFVSAVTETTTGVAPKDMWLRQNLGTTLDELTAERNLRMGKPLPQVAEGMPEGTIADLKKKVGEASDNLERMQTSFAYKGKATSQDVISARSVLQEAQRQLGEAQQSAIRQGTEEQVVVETDVAKIQEIKNSIAEGQMILKSGKSVTGRKMSPEELGAVQRSVDKARAKIEPALPQAQPGMPEAGLQAGIPGMAAAEVVRPQPTGRLVQARIDDYLRLREYNKKAVADRIAEIKKQLETKGLAKTARGDLNLELARLEAQQEVDAVENIADLDSLIKEVETELGNRSMPYHGGARSLFKGYTTRQLEEMRNVYLQARQSMPEVPVIEPAPMPETPPEVINRVKTDPTPASDEIILKKFIDCIKDAKPAREVTEALKHEELQRRSAIFASILQGGEGNKAFEKAKGALRGFLPQGEYLLDLQRFGITDAEIERMVDRIRLDDKLRPFEKLNTYEAFTNLVMGAIPTEGELLLLEKEFGSEFVKAIMSKLSAGAKALKIAQDIANVPRTLVTIADLSATFRQGAVLAFGQPVQFSQAFVSQLKAVFSEKNFKLIDEIVHNNVYADKAEQHKLYVAPISEVVSVTAREEAFMGRLIERVPLLGSIIRASERAYVTFLNVLRMETWAYYCRQWEGTGKTSADYGKLALFINHASGRGDLGAFSKAAAWLSAIFFSPRFIMSRVQVALDLINTTPAVRKVIARNLVAFVGTGMLALFLARLAGAETEDDPRSADFGKIKIGNTRIDFWGGYLPYVRLITQIITEERKSTKTGEVYKIIDPIDVGVNFFRSKLAPVPGFLWDLKSGETFIGEELTAENAEKIIFEKLTPMFIQDLIEAVKDSGLAAGIGYGMLSALGVGIQTYSDNWESAELKLGLPVREENFPYTIENEVYDVKDYYSEISDMLQIGAAPGATYEMLSEKKNIPPLVLSVAQARDIVREIGFLPNKRLTSINADSTKGDTFEQYRVQWLAREKITNADELAKFDKDYPDAYLGNITQAQYALLVEYHSLPESEQADFLGNHPELYINPREEWLRTHPEENALLVLWGKADPYSTEAVNKVSALVKSLGIPENALVMKDLDRVTELKLKNQSLFDLVEAYGGLDDTFKGPDGLTARDRAIKQLYLDNPDFRDDERRIDALNVGTKDNPTLDSMVEGWVERGQMADEFGSSSPEMKLWLIDNREVHQWALENGLLSDTGEDWNENILRLQVNYREDFDKYDNYGDAASPLYIANDDARADAREGMLFSKDKMTSFGVAYYTINALEKNIPENLVTSYVDYYGIRKKEAVDYSAGWYEDDWFILEHPDFYDTMTSLGLWQAKDFTKVPTRQVYSLYKTYMTLPTGQPRLDFRAENKALDGWLVFAKGYTPVGNR